MCAVVQTARGPVHILTSVRASYWAQRHAQNAAAGYQGIVMYRDQVRGRLKEAEGKVNEVTGKILGNKSLEERGQIQQIVGQVQASCGDRRISTRKLINL